MAIVHIAIAGDEQQARRGSSSETSVSPHHNQSTNLIRRSALFLIKINSCPHFHNDKEHTKTLYQLQWLLGVE
jgi:hypothetical protein